MGLLDFLSPKSSEEKRAESVRKGRVVPEKSERQKCWNARDEYYACLDRSGIVNALAEAEKAMVLCKTEEENFERNCPAAWVGISSIFPCTYISTFISGYSFHFFLGGGGGWLAAWAGGTNP